MAPAPTFFSSETIVVLLIVA